MKLKSKSKKGQTELLERIEAALSEPSKLIPECLDGGMFCPFSSYSKKISTIESLEDYNKFSRSADQFLRGLSETEEVLESNSVPIVGIFTTAYGSVEYAKRSDTDPSVLAGIQHSSNPMWRMLAFYSLVYNRDVRIFSSTNYYLASCKGTSPDREFFQDCLNDEKIHYKDSGIIEVGSGDTYFEVSYLGRKILRIYESSSDNTLKGILKHILSKNPLKDFSLVFSFSDKIDISKERFLSDYLAGKITDRELLKNAKDKHLDVSLKSGSYIIGHRIFSEAGSFLSEFTESPFDPQKLLPVLNEKGSVKLDVPSMGKLLEILWPQYSKDIIELLYPGSVPGDLKGSPLKQIEAIQHKIEGDTVKADLESVTWSEESSLLLKLIKTFKADGKEIAVKDALFSMKNSQKSSSVCYAFLSSTGAIKGREWMFDKTAIDLGEKIRPLIDKLLVSDMLQFKERFNELKMYI